MGDRGNLCIRYEHDRLVYFYTHWSGYTLPTTLQAALKRAGENRWGDPAYLARIIFCELVKEDPMGTTDFGVGVEMGENEPRRGVLVVDTGDHAVYVLDPQTHFIKKGTSPVSFDDFVAMPVGEGSEFHTIFDGR